MVIKKTVLKVDISCHKCKKKLLKAISGLQGVDKIEAAEAKGTLSVTGDADPYDIIVLTRKAGKFVELVSVGPPPAPSKQEPQKPDPKVEIHNPDTCPICLQMSLASIDRYADSNTACSIM